MITIHELFETVRFDGISYDEEMLFDKARSDAFVKKSCSRNEANEETQSGILLDRTPISLERKSIRRFRKDQMISYSIFSEFLNVLRKEIDGETERFTFPSAGGLYPIDVYLYIKEQRVEQLEAGIYHYQFSSHSLRLISEDTVPVTTHYYGNREIFQTSAYSLYFFYHPESSVPKYGGMGLFYGILDTGIMLQQLSLQAVSLQLGSCIIGDLNDEKLRNELMKQGESVYLCSMEVGIPATGMDQKT